MSDIAKEAWRKYLIQLQAHPLRTKVFSQFISLVDSSLLSNSCLSSCFVLVPIEFSFLFDYNFLGASGNNFWGVSWIQRCNCAKDFWDQKASVEKIAAYHGTLTSLLLFFNSITRIGSGSKKESGKFVAYC